MKAELDTVQGRLATFKKPSINGKVLKWPHRRLSMISMVRAFFYYDPKPEAKDCVVCVYCGDRFTNWASIHKRPICRHAESNRDCMVARLARILIAIDEGTNVCYETIESAFKETFMLASTTLPEQTVKLLTFQGFILLPESPTNKETVGCIQCGCFPQDALGTPKHRSKCKVSSFILNAHTAANTSREFEETSSSAHYCIKEIGDKSMESNKNDDDDEKEEGKIRVSMPQTTQDAAFEEHEQRSTLSLKETKEYKPLKPIVNSQNHDTTAQSDKENYSVGAQSIKLIATIEEDDLVGDISKVELGSHRRINVKPSEAETVEFTKQIRSTVIDPHEPEQQLMSPSKMAALQCSQLFSELKLDGESRRVRLEEEALNNKYTPEQLIGHMEILAISILEEAHVKRIQIIQQETERVVSQLLSSNSD